MQGALAKSTRDALLIIHYDIDRSIPKADLELLEYNGYIARKHPSGWMTTSRGRNYVKTIKRGESR